MRGEFLNQSRSDPSDDSTADPTRTPTFSDVRKIYTVMVINGRADGLPILEGCYSLGVNAAAGYHGLASRKQVKIAEE